MRSTRVWDEKDPEGEAFTRIYHCVSCVAKERNTSEEEARAYLAQTAPDAEYKRSRCERYNQARSEVKEVGIPQNLMCATSFM